MVARGDGQARANDVVKWKSKLATGLVVANPSLQAFIFLIFFKIFSDEDNGRYMVANENNIFFIF